MSDDTLPNELEHRHQRGLHHHSVDVCPDCGEETKPCTARYTWIDPPDIVGVKASECSCYQPGAISKLKRWLKEQ